MAPPASSGWLETASEMERYVRSGESAQDIADFALGEVEGGAQTLKSTAVGTARLIRHPVQGANQLGQAVLKSGPALSEFSKHSEDIVAGAIEKKWTKFVDASNRERGRMTGSGLMEVGLTVAPFPKASKVVSASWNGLVRTLPKSALADRVIALPGKCYKISNELGRNVEKLRPSARKQAMNYIRESGDMPEKIAFTPDGNTAYYPGWDTLRIAPDLLPHRSPPVGTLGANSRIGMKGCIAHELKGHRAAALAGKTHPNPILEEAQASIRGARFGHNLTKAERYTLLRDAISRLSQRGIRIRDVKADLWIHEP
ncbi:hypothetical protein ABS71_03740 [bacterium SCN 62-11]|nr:MAG: hypothetical protein ABS71_03740 [bacterium SCN 62-11]